jgi:hypothetical protein
MENLSLQSSNGRSTKAREKNQTPFEILCAADEQINPAILLAEELMRKDIAEILDFDDLARAEKTLELSRREIESVAGGFEALAKTPALASAQIPIGF